MTDDVVKFQRQKPDWEEEKEFRARICNALLDAGYSAIEAADVLLYAAYNFHCYAEGADEHREGWYERAAKSFQKAVAGFCVENAGHGIDFDESDCIRLPYL